MTADFLAHDEVAEELRALAVAAAPTPHARPDLARVVVDRARAASRRRARRAGAVVGGGLLVLAGVAASRQGSGTHFAVIQPSAAMTPTIGVGEQVVFDKRLEPRRGDVVYAHIAVDRFDHLTISRVVAVAGETVGCPAGPLGVCEEIVVDGSPVVERYLGGMAVPPFAAVTVPPGFVFLLGDNRGDASDSRVYGPIGQEAVTGVGVSVVAPGRDPRPIPGSPPHLFPNGSDAVDPANVPPEASVHPR